jgi:hypothetical protein
LKIGAPNTNRTCDLPLRRRLLYPLSYRGVVARYSSGNPDFPNPETKMAGVSGHSGVWWSGGGSNSRPLHCERSALPAELPPQTIEAYSTLLTTNFGMTQKKPHLLGRCGFMRLLYEWNVDYLDRAAAVSRRVSSNQTSSCTDSKSRTSAFAVPIDVSGRASCKCSRSTANWRNGWYQN